MFNSTFMFNTTFDPQYTFVILFINIIASVLFTSVISVMFSIQAFLFA